MAIRLVVAFDFDTDDLAQAYAALQQGLAPYDGGPRSLGHETIEWWPHELGDEAGDDAQLTHVAAEYWRLNPQPEDRL